MPLPELSTGSSAECSPESSGLGDAVPFDQVASEIQKTKRKRGRPSNAELAARAASDAESASQTSSLSEFGIPSSTETNPVCGSNNGAGAAQPPSLEIPKEVLAPAIQFPFSIAAKRTGFDGFNLEKEHVDAIVPLVDQCIRQYLPNTLGPHSALIMLCGTLVAVGGMKYMMYLDWKAQAAPPSDVAANK